MALGVRAPVNLKTLNVRSRLASGRDRWQGGAIAAQSRQQDGIRPLARDAQLILACGSFMAMIAGIQLFVGTEHTDDYFAWTIQPPLTAAFLGA
jgi:hypothetical protein